MLQMHTKAEYAENRLSYGHSEGTLVGCPWTHTSAAAHPLHARSATGERVRRGPGRLGWGGPPSTLSRGVPAARGKRPHPVRDMPGATRDQPSLEVYLRQLHGRNPRSPGTARSQGRTQSRHFGRKRTAFLREVRLAPSPKENQSRCVCSGNSLDGFTRGFVQQSPHLRCTAEARERRKRRPRGR